jgi:hypothetical protein
VIERRADQATKMHPADHPTLDQLCALEHREIFGNLRGGDRKRLAKLGDGARTPTQPT